MWIVGVDLGFSFLISLSIACLCSLGSEGEGNCNMSQPLLLVPLEQATLG